MEGSVIIFDEAHNIEHTAEDGCSITITDTNLTTAIAELNFLRKD